jgi:hypothetical protein
MPYEQDVAEVVPAEETPEVVKEEVVEATIPTEPQEEVVPSTQEVKPEVHDNRPIENVAWETKRKLDETLPTIQRQIEELSTYIKENRTQPQTPTYTKAQLQAYASDPTTTTEQRLWAYTEVDKQEKEDRRKEYESLVTSTQRKTHEETRRNQSAQWVAQNFPDTVVKDQTGNVMGWNNQSPILAKANEYMNRSENLRNDPEGFMAAVKMAAFDMGASVNLQNKVKSTIGQLRKEQKKQLASAGGTKPAETSDVIKKNRMDKLKEEYARTGNREVFAEIVKMKGMNPFV